MQKSMTVGVDIGHDFLRLVKMAKATDATPKLIELKAVPIPTRATTVSAEFESFLRAELNAFCGPAKSVKVWANMSAAHVDVHHIRIPKVAKKQIVNTVYYSAKREITLDERESIFDFVLQGEVIDQGIPKLAVMYYTVPRREVEETKRLFSRIGMPLAGISVAPFAIENILRNSWIPGKERTIAHLFIGNDFSRIDIYARGNLAMTRGIKAGTSSMVESFAEAFNETKVGSPRISGSAQPISLDQARKIVTSLGPDYPALREGDTGFGLQEDEIFAMIRPALERLSRQVERTFEHYATSPGSEPIDQILVTSLLRIYPKIMSYVGDELGIAGGILDPLSPDLPGVVDGEGFKAINVSDRMAFGPALGLALADDAVTPNFIFTFKDKEEKAGGRFINQVISVLFIAALIVCSGIFLYQISAAGEKKAEMATLERQLSQYGPRVDQGMIMASLDRMRLLRQTAKAYSERYLGMAVIGEIADLTPRDISLMSISAGLSRTAVPTAGPGQQPQAAAPKAGSNILTIEGMIFGERSALESVLASYVMKLESSPMFSSVRVAKSDLELLKKRQVLHFTVEAKIG